MKKVLVFFMLCPFIVWNRVTDANSVKNITLMGSIGLFKGIESIDGLPVIFKGCEYDVRVETIGDTKKAYFELYDEEKPRCLYLVITEYLKKPTDQSIDHLVTSPDHRYRAFKISRSMFAGQSPFDVLMLNNDKQESWVIEELDNTVKEFIIPDQTIVVFMPAEIFDRFEQPSVVNVGTTLTLPTILLKQHNKDLLADLASRMKLAFLDFKLLHKKPYKALVPCSSNHILSMPFTPRSYA
jgi:hypothetical protein